MIHKKSDYSFTKRHRIPITNYRGAKKENQSLKDEINRLKGEKESQNIHQCS